MAARTNTGSPPVVMRVTLLTAVALLALLLLAARPASAQEIDGETLYRQNCAGCHQVNGAGIVGTFPPLVDNDRVDDLDYLIDTITNGREGAIEVGGIEYNGVMPGFGASLSAEEIQAVAAYVQNDLGSTTTATTLPPLAITPLPENAIIGEQMFLGQTAFENGGPACAACHAAGEHGDLARRSAGYGPDLTDSWARLGGADGVIDAVRVHPGGMEAVYEEGPLTVDEIGSVAAFLEVAADSRRSEILDDLVLIAAAAFGILIAGTALVASNRREREGAQ